jgi:hypothetical protein
MTDMTKTDFRRCLRCQARIRKGTRRLADQDWFYSSFHHSHPILTERLKAMNWTGDKKISDEKAKDDEKPVKAADREL